MTFKSLFIGVDKYQSPLISNLSCSVRDAMGFHGLFGDAFGTASSMLLTNDQATRSNIQKAIEDLQRSDSDDVVVIGFSGHGSDSHHLITHDADPFALDASAIHLDELPDLFSRIPASNVVSSLTAVSLAALVQKCSIRRSPREMLVRLTLC